MAKKRFEISPFGETGDGRKISKVILRNINGIELAIINFGATIQSLKTPDKYGYIDEITLGHKDFEQYWQKPQYIGAIIGPCANRIANARFELDGIIHNLPANERQKHSLHSGPEGFDKRIWEIAGLDEDDFASAVKFKLSHANLWPDFEGHMEVEVQYILNDNGEIIIEYSAVCDCKAIINLTSHPYFNLAGIKSGRLGNEAKLQIFADFISEIDEEFIPTGKLLAVQNTPFDFSQPVQFKLREGQTQDPQIKIANGIDHNFILTPQTGAIKPAAILHDEISGRKLEIFTTEPCLQIYGGNHFDGSLKDHADKPVFRFYGIALEPQKFPNAINNQYRDNVLFDANERYFQKTIYKFSAH